MGFDLSVVIIVLVVINIAVTAIAFFRSKSKGCEASLRLDGNDSALSSALASALQSVQRLEISMAQLEKELSHTKQGLSETSKHTSQQLEQIRTLTDQRLRELRTVVDTNLHESLKQQQEVLSNQQRALNDQLTTSNKSLEELRKTLSVQIKALQDDNNAQLERMRVTVDEKLKKTLNSRITQSFQLVNDRLQQVDQGLGEMKGLAQDVGGLKKVLSNVKTRGIVGEVQLAAILKEILAPGQYAVDVETVAGSGKRVEFAVKLPGENDETVWLPIDSKFPGDAYEHLRDAQDGDDPDAVTGAWKVLEERLKREAADIHEKYISPPQTTNFGILFLPFEGLYAEVVDRPGLIERLQRDYRVNVAGPSTMAALLNSLQMGFQTVAIQKRANDIQRVLSAVKTEFGKYQDLLGKAQKQLGTVTKTIDSLAGTRTRAMDRQLRSITELDSIEEADAVLGVDTKLLDSAALDLDLE